MNVYVHILKVFSSFIFEKTKIHFVCRCIPFRAFDGWTEETEFRFIRAVPLDFIWSTGFSCKTREMRFKSFDSQMGWE